jgi:hypothetical protein
MNVEGNKRLMQTLDDTWNSQAGTRSTNGTPKMSPCTSDTFNKWHAENVAVY